MKVKGKKIGLAAMRQVRTVFVFAILSKSVHTRMIFDKLIPNRFKLLADVQDLPVPIL